MAYPFVDRHVWLTLIELLVVGHSILASHDDGWVVFRAPLSAETKAGRKTSQKVMSDVVSASELTGAALCRWVRSCRAEFPSSADSAFARIVRLPSTSSRLRLDGYRHPQHTTTYH